MTKLDPRTMSALRSLKTNPDFEQVLRWMEDSRRDLHAQLESLMDERLVRQAQGSAQAIKAILDAAAKAASL